MPELLMIVIFASTFALLVASAMDTYWTAQAIRHDFAERCKVSRWIVRRFGEAGLYIVNAAVLALVVRGSVVVARQLEYGPPAMLIAFMFIALCLYGAVSRHTAAAHNRRVVSVLRIRK